MARVVASTKPPRPLTVETPQGAARVHLHRVADARGALVLGHGAGGGVNAPDLTVATEVATDAGFSVALVEQPYRVAGRRSPAPARQLDAAWTAVCERLARRELKGLGLITGGRSSGARVACRTAASTGARAVLCLAFPLSQPRRPPSADAPTRLPELDAVSVPVLVVQGSGDPFGIPAPGRGRSVVVVPGNHRLATDLDAVGRAVSEWLAGLA
jgi:predicted alpha/beta-hydrolase family hydrolase